MPRKIEILKEELVLKESVELVYEKRITAFGNACKIDAPKKHLGKRAYVVIVKD
jgi:putative transposon-encoded protein